MSLHKKLDIPRWVIVIYAFAAVTLVPWTVYLASNLPSRQIADHWDAAWVGFDIFMFFLAALTAIYAYRRSARVILSATSLAIILIIDSWFDVLTARPGVQQLESIFYAAFIEIPLALLTLSLVQKTLKQINWDNHNLRMRK